MSVKRIRFSKLGDYCEEHYGKRSNRSTYERWRRRGIRGVKLETYLHGGTRWTTAESLEQFFAESTAAADNVSPSVAASPTAVNSANAFLESEGA